MTTSNCPLPADLTTLRELARQLEHDSSARTAQTAGLILTCLSIVSLIVLSVAGRSNTISTVLIAAGLITFSVASRVVRRTAIDRGTLTDRMLGAIADSDSIPEWAKFEVAAEYSGRGDVTVATLTEIDSRIVEQRAALRAAANSTPGADRLLGRYSNSAKTGDAPDRSGH
ncbi:hypothetical protein KTE49_13785 [Burkholderia multivorans]|nr:MULTISPECIES: hypothetical protein [Burkholderia cepacia complex]AIO71576.1 hypothetical protein DM80_5804 [Burkholderia multivorans]MBJ9616012.1 hypothetical protein [Burkholderia multivorans]MBU9122858.1 hypothetical protein [Burkholderia multivorans]MBU9146579.1 hypothetical protein [Burkholderia multivorans]MBU9203971.1 hypothetical protein [Burkholderia multivorans]